MFAGKMTRPDAEDPDTLNHLIWYEATGFKRPYPGEKTVRPPTEFKKSAAGKPDHRCRRLTPVAVDRWIFAGRRAAFKPPVDRARHGSSPLSHRQDRSWFDAAASTGAPPRIGVGRAIIIAIATQASPRISTVPSPTPPANRDLRSPIISVSARPIGQMTHSK